LEGGVACDVYIRRNADGVVHLHRDTWCGSFLWGPDGNYGCDCNRRLFFARAAGEEEEHHGTCSEGAFSVRITVDGVQVYADGDWP
jgi:hypothetical protein